MAILRYSESTTNTIFYSVNHQMHPALILQIFDQGNLYVAGYPTEVDFPKSQCRQPSRFGFVSPGPPCLLSVRVLGLVSVATLPLGPIVKHPGLRTRNAR